MSETELSYRADPVSSGLSERCSVVGRMIDKDGCYALAEAGDRATWLEMDRIPLHLLDRDVQVEGDRYRDLIVVRSIRPA